MFHASRPVCGKRRLRPTLCRGPDSASMPPRFTSRWDVNDNAADPYTYLYAIDTGVNEGGGIPCSCLNSQFFCGFELRLHDFLDFFPAANNLARVRWRIRSSALCQMKREHGVWLWGAHAPRVLAKTPSSSRTFFRQCAQTKFVSASRRNRHAKRVRSPDQCSRFK